MTISIFQLFYSRGWAVVGGVELNLLVRDQRLKDLAYRQAVFF
jgi:hypothetical protein